MSASRATVCAVVLVGLIFPPAATLGQSTFGAILGTVTDASGAVIQNAIVKATNTDENTTCTEKTNGSGGYEFVNTKPGHYQVEISVPGFQTSTATGLQLIARQVLRLDVGLQVGQSSSSLNVQATGGVITTDTQTIQSNLDGQALLSLPGNVRAGGSTSPYGLIAVLPGVQPDDYSNFSIQGGIPSMSQFSVDGISTTCVCGNFPIRDAFPSLESIAEIKVQGAGSAAEFGEVGDVTTISKSGTNDLHGALFWYHQNRALDATAYGQQVKPQKIGNDFGISAGGPVLIPGFYNGRNKTFFLSSFEGFRFPLAQTIQNTVPTEAMRTGDFSQTAMAFAPRDPLTGKPFPGGLIPADRISTVAKGFLALYPLPNAGDLSQVHAANYIDNRDNGLSSNQYDLRIDHYLTPKMSVFGRWTWKSIGQAAPHNLLLPSALVTNDARLFVVSWNWMLRPNLVNEFRLGATLGALSIASQLNGVKFTSALGLVGLGPDFPFDGLPFVRINGYQSLDAGRANINFRTQTYQVNNNTTWSIGRHTIKFGFDMRRIRTTAPIMLTGSDNYGDFNFTGVFSGNAFADFLLGLPQNTRIDNVRHDVDGRSFHYAIFVQDSFRVNRRLTLEYGLRWEYHPAYNEAYGNLGNFDPSIPKSGAVIYPTGKQSLLAPLFLASFNACPAPDANGAACTPVLSASQAHVPESLRTAPRRLAPRFGFAFRPFSNDKTVLRGGFGVYETPSLGSIFRSLTGTLQSDVQVYDNVAPTGGPIFQWPEIRTGGNGLIPPFGKAGFSVALPIHWKEPYTMQWNFSIERDLGFDTGLRISYIGMGTRDLVWGFNLNQSNYSTQYYASQPLSSRPFPNWAYVGTLQGGANANYQSAQVEVSHRLRHGLAFNSAFTIAKNLADNQGASPQTVFADEAFGRWATLDANNRRAEYGNVAATRRHRWITTAVYELPMGPGRALLPHANRLVKGVLGGWRLSGIFLVQSGPYETPYFFGGDPSGTGSGPLGIPQHPDRVRSGSLAHPSADQWIDPTAFVCPGVPGWVNGQRCTIGVDPRNDLPPIGRFGNSGIGVVTGPGTINLSAGLGKAFAVSEAMKLKVEGSFTNVLNHVNLSDPQMGIDAPNFGQITTARGSDFGGYRTGQVSVRLEF